MTFATAIEYLSAADEDMATLISHIGPCALQIHPTREPYEALIRAISHQQLHGKAAESILGRFIQLFPDSPFPTPEGVLSIDESVLRNCGFSTSKIAAIRDIAHHSFQGTLPTRLEAEDLSDEALIDRLIPLRGVGRWTVEMLLIFTLGRPDILPVDDFGIREGWRLIKSHPEQLKPKALALTTQHLSPYRTVASWYLWQAANQNKKKQ